MRVNLRIERLIVEAGPLEIAGIRRALRAELTRRFTSEPLPASLRSGDGAAVRALSAAPVQLPDTPSPKQWGHGIARAVHGVIGT